MKMYKKVCYKTAIFCLDVLRKIGIKIPRFKWEKCFYIATALETDEGKMALAKAMIEPIRKSLMS